MAMKCFLVLLALPTLKPDSLTGIMPRVKSVGYLYLSDLSVFLRIFCRVPGTSGTVDASAPVRRH